MTINADIYQGDEELIILRSRSQCRVYAEFVRSFVDEGVYFPFSDDYLLPEQLPENLERVKCIMMEAETRAECEAGAEAAALRRFVTEGGLIFTPDPKTQVGGALGYFAAMHYVQRVICCAGLTPRHPRMLERFYRREEGRLVRAWRGAAAEELRQYENMQNYFGDPVGYITLRAGEEAADFFNDPAALQPGDEYLAKHYQEYSGPYERTGGRHLLNYARRSGRDEVTRHVLEDCRKPRLWRLGGVHLNMDLIVPAGADPDAPPRRLRENAWTWPETAGDLGSTLGALSLAVGDPAWAEAAVRHVTQAFRWLYNPENGLIMHVGRPGGPDLRSAPWGRGNAWFLYAVRGLLDDLPDTHPARPELVGMLQTLLDGLLRYQDEFGLWHNVLDAAPEDSRPCSSATSRFLHVYARAYHKGWLRDQRIPEMVENAWNGLKTKIWENGLIACCVGTSHSLNRQTYLSRPHHTFRTSRSEMLINWIERERLKQCL